MILLMLMATEITAPKVLRILENLNPLIQDLHSRYQNEPSQEAYYLEDGRDPNLSSYIEKITDSKDEEIVEKILEWRSTALCPYEQWMSHFQSHLEEAKLIVSNLSYDSFFSVFQTVMLGADDQEKAKWIAQYINHFQKKQNSQIALEQESQSKVGTQQTAARKGSLSSSSDEGISSVSSDELRKV